MDNIVLTPSQLWAGYTPNKNLRTTYFNFKQEDTCNTFESFFDGDAVGAEHVRIYAKTCTPTAFSKDVIIAINDFSQSLPRRIVEQYVEDGFCVVEFDYTGKSPKKSRYSIYPTEIQYANLAVAESHLTEASPSAKDTCVYVWTKVLRCVVSYALELCGEGTNVYLLGIKNGCDLMWQAAGMDSRIKAVTAIINGGWKEFSSFQRYCESAQDFVMTDERSRWLSACAPQSYTKFVKCPTLFIAASNNPSTSVDRIESSLRLIDNKYVLCYICSGLSDSIDNGGVTLIRNWFSSSKNNTRKRSMPTIKIVEGALDTALVTVTISDIDDISDITVNYSYDEVYPTLRNWKIANVSFANPTLELPIASHHFLFAYATLTFKNGSSLSSYPVCLDLRQHQSDASAKRLNHIIYQRKMATLGWYVEGENCFGGSKPLIKTGELDIGGISTDSGDLITYTISEGARYCEDTNILQFDCFSQSLENLTISLTTFEKGQLVNYSATAPIQSRGWTKLSFELQDFKSKELISLKTWQNVKKLSFKNPRGTIFNNLIWV